MKALALTLWIVFILTEATLNWYAIEKLKRNIVHWVWFIPRVFWGVLFLIWYINLGYMWYWAGVYILTTHALLFPEALNIMRGKKLMYLGDPNLDSPTKSLYDKIIMMTIEYEYVWFMIRGILFLFGVGNMIFQGECTWYELNNGLCN